MWLRKKLGVIIVILGLLSSPLLAQVSTIPALAGVTVGCKINFDPTLQAFFFTYRIANPPQSIGSINDFEVDINRPPGGQILDRAGLSDNLAAIEGVEWDDSIWKDLGDKVVPLVILSGGDKKWGASPSMSHSINFSSSLGPNWKSASDVAPRSSAEGLQIASHGLVGVRKFHVKAEYPSGMVSLPLIDKISVGPNQDRQVAQALTQYGEYLAKVNFYGDTLGPTALPQNCDPACMVQFLINEKEQAYKLGWITSAGVANALDKKLLHSKEELQEGETQVAAHILKSFILDLKAQHREEEPESEKGQSHEREKENESKHITDNAYYLLKPNAEFILFKLSQQEEEKGQHEK